MNSSAKKSGPTSGNVLAPRMAVDTLPLLLIACKGLDSKTIRSELKEEGLDCIFVSNVSDLFKHLDHVHAFAVYMDVDFCANSIEVLRRSTQTKKAYWTMIGGPMSPRLASTFLSAGAGDILAAPVHPYQIKSRARALLTKFEEQYGFPPYVLLPWGIGRRTPSESTTGSRWKVIPSSPRTEKANFFEPAEFEKFLKPEIPIQILGKKEPAQRKQGEPFSDPVLARVELNAHWLKPDVDWNRGLWPGGGAPLSIYSKEPGHVRGLSQMTYELHRLLQECSWLIRASRLVLLSLKPTAPLWENQDFPKKLFSLTSSDEVPLQNEVVDSALFPQIQVAFDRQRSMYLPIPVPATVGELKRPSSWKLSKGSEVASAVFPIQGERGVFAVILAQFDTPPNFKTIEQLNEAASFFKHYESDYLTIDFLCRAYRQFN